MASATPAIEHHSQLAGTNLYCLVNRGTCVWTTCPRSFVKRRGRDSNLRPIGCKSDALTTTPPRHTNIQRWIIMFRWPELILLVLLYFVLHKLAQKCRTTGYQAIYLSRTRRTAIANGMCVRFCNQPKAQFGYPRRVTPVCRCLHPFCGWRHLATLRESKAHFGLPWVRPWDNCSKCYMDGKRIQCLSNASVDIL